MPSKTTSILCVSYSAEATKTAVSIQSIPSYVCKLFVIMLDTAFLENWRKAELNSKLTPGWQKIIEVAIYRFIKVLAVRKKKL